MGDALYKAVAFFLLPIYLKYLTPSDYGVLESVIVTRSLAILLLSLGISSAFFVYYFRAKSEAEKRLIFSTSFLSFIVLQIPLPLCFLLFNKWISNLILTSPEFGLYFAIVAVNVFLISFRMVPLQLYRAKNQALRYSVIQFVVAMATMFFNIFFVVFLHLGVKGVLLGNLCGGLIGIFLVLPTIMKNFVFRFDFNVAKKLLKYGVPLGLAQLPIGLVFLSDRYFIAHLSDLAAIGLYSVGYKFGVIIKICIVVPILTAWNPFLFEHAEDQDAPNIFSKVISCYCLICMTMVVLVSLCAAPIIKIIGKAPYLSAHEIVPFICIGMFLFGLAQMLRVGILLSGKTYLITIILSVTFLTNAAGNLMLIPSFGIAGAAYSFLLSMIVNTGLSYILGMKQFLIPLEKHRITKVLVAGISVIGIANYFTILDVLKEILLKTGFFVGFIAFILLTRCISKKEIKSITDSMLKSRSVVI